MAISGSETQWTEVVSRATRGDPAARTAIHDAFARVVHGIALAHVGPGAAEDVTQEVFCSVFASLATLRDGSALPGFVCAAARNASLDVLRQRRRTPATASTDGLAAREPSPATRVEQRELAERVLACIQTLPDAYRETLVLRLVSGLSGPEIAERTGMTHGSVRVNLTRGMALLRPRLQEAGLP